MYELPFNIISLNVEPYTDYTGKSGYVVMYTTSDNKKYSYGAMFNKEVDVEACLTEIKNYLGK
jgi:hypothetical protein